MMWKKQRLCILFFFGLVKGGKNNVIFSVHFSSFRFKVLISASSAAFLNSSFALSRIASCNLRVFLSNCAPSTSAGAWGFLC